MVDNDLVAKGLKHQRDLIRSELFKRFRELQKNGEVPIETVREYDYQTQLEKFIELYIPDGATFYVKRDAEGRKIAAWFKRMVKKSEEIDQLLSQNMSDRVKANKENLSH